MLMQQQQRVLLHSAERKRGVHLSNARQQQASDTWLYQVQRSSREEKGSERTEKQARERRKQEKSTR